MRSNEATRHFTEHILSILCVLLPLSDTPAVNAQPQWMRLPETPALPKPALSGHASVNDIKIWYAVFGSGEPVILLHGGLANSDYWGNQVSALAPSHQVIVMDSRGHGRSTRNGQPITYDLMASDVIALMDFLKIKKAAIVGWSDGANVGLSIAITNPDRVTKLFAFAGNSAPSGVKDASTSPVFKAYLERTEQEYKQLSATPNEYRSFVDDISKMWATQPDFTLERLKNIRVPTWIVDADHDEAIRRENTLFMADQIPGASLLIQPSVSHFSFLQDPKQFNQDVLHFLESVSKL